MKGNKHSMINKKQKCHPGRYFEKNQTHFRPEGGLTSILFQFRMFQRKKGLYRASVRKLFRFRRRQVIIFHTIFKELLKNAKMMRGNPLHFGRKYLLHRVLWTFSQLVMPNNDFCSRSSSDFVFGLSSIGGGGICPRVQYKGVQGPPSNIGLRKHSSFHCPICPNTMQNSHTHTA